MIPKDQLHPYHLKIVNKRPIMGKDYEEFVNYEETFAGIKQFEGNINKTLDFSISLLSGFKRDPLGYYKNASSIAYPKYFKEVVKYGLNITVSTINETFSSISRLYLDLQDYKIPNIVIKSFQFHLSSFLGENYSFFPNGNYEIGLIDVNKHKLVK